jgi:hypothetical protein
MNTLGLLGKCCLFTMDLDIMNKEETDANMFAFHVVKGVHCGLVIPNVFLVHSSYPIEVHSLTTPTMNIPNPKDDIFVRKYVHCDMRLTRNQESTATSLIDYYALGYSNMVTINGVNIKYALMLCVSNDADKIFYKIQLTALNKDIDIDLYATTNIFCITDPHKKIELKKNQRVEFDYIISD